MQFSTMLQFIFPLLWNFIGNLAVQSSFNTAIIECTGLLSVLHWVPLITHKANREAQKAEKLTFSWCTQLWIGSSMVCAVHHFKLNWNKTARQKNENSMTMCYKCACYYDEWYDMSVAMKIQMHAGQVIYLKYGT